MSELDTMSLDELKEQADILEVAYPHNITQATLLKKVEAALNGEEAEEEAPAPKVEQPKAVDIKKKVWIVISEDPTDNQTAFVGVNGKSFRIKRGIPVEIPEYILPTLKRAQKEVLDAQTKTWRKIPTYSYQIIEKP